jgi:hypothetical protein
MMQLLAATLDAAGDYNLGLNQDAGFAAEVGFSLQDDA